MVAIQRSTTEMTREEFQQFLDTHQYTKNGILRYEKVFGRGFVSTGGKETTEMYASKLAMKPGEKLLDVGCGIGGSAIHFVKTFKCSVVGVDLSTNMIEIGKERAQEEGVDNVEFRIADATRDSFENESYDAVYSRDAILHIEDKVSLFKRFLSWLRPGGRLLITDYCRGEGERSTEFETYVKQRGYHLVTPQNYGKCLEEAGFKNVEAIDNTDVFLQVLDREIKWLESHQEEFVKEFSQNDYDYLLEGWKAKVKRCHDGDQRWGLFYAEKA